MGTVEWTLQDGFITNCFPKKNDNSSWQYHAIKWYCCFCICLAHRFSISFVYSLSMVKTFVYFVTLQNKWFVKVSTLIFSWAVSTSRPERLFSSKMRVLLLLLPLFSLSSSLSVSLTKTDAKPLLGWCLLINYVVLPLQYAQPWIL